MLLKIEFLFTIFLFLMPKADAGQLNENFLNANQKDGTTTTAVWNIQLGMIHSPLVTDYTNNGVDNEDQPIDVGDGSDGPFDVPTYALFSIGGITTGNVITIDTSVHPYLQLTYFYLAPGWTISGTGPNPLWFKVQGTFTNAGTINCSGTSGDSITSNFNSVAQGGVGRCGGGNGGSGGATGVNATSGTTGGVGVSGGSSSANSSAPGTYATGGGGGGGYNTVSPSLNGGPGGAGAALGANTADDHILDFGPTNGPGGGSGGGGGGAYLVIDGNQSRGGGGGAGGGVIRISAVGNFTNSGSILARGGDGGGASSAAGAGSGGAGSGGTVWIQTAGTYTDSGNIDATRGAFGLASAPGTGAGGRGCQGRTWFTTPNQVYNVTGSEAPSTNLLDLGLIHYSKNAYMAQSLTYDLLNTNPVPTILNLQTSLPGTSTATALVAGSNDAFKNDSTGFVPLTQLSLLNGKRFFKFQIQLQLSGPPPAIAPASVSSVSLLFNGVRQSSFPMSPSCGYIGSPGEFLFIYSLCGLAVFFTNGRRTKELLWHRKTTTNLL